MSEEIPPTETADPKTEEEIVLEQPVTPAPPTASTAAGTTDSILSTLEQRAQRRGCGVLVLSTVLGAVLGAVIALIALAVINGGTLDYNTSQTRRDISTAQEIQSNLSTQLESLSGQLEGVNDRLDSVTAQGTESAQGLSQLQTDVTQIEADFEGVIEASKAVDEFLVAFRAMLEALPDGATAVEPTPTPDSTP